MIFQKWKLGLVASEFWQQNMENGKCVKAQIGLERFSYCTASLGGWWWWMRLRNHRKICVSMMRHAYFQELNQFHCVVEPNSCLSPGLEQNMCRNTNGTCSYAINFPKQKLCQALLHTRVYEEAIHSLQNNGPNSAFGPGQQKLSLLCV